MIKYAKHSTRQIPYECVLEWPEDCHVQCGGRDGDYFFEAYPKNPDTYMSVHGETLAEAEEKAFNLLQKYIKCDSHVFIRKGYTNGAGFCEKCGLFKGKAFLPSTTCYLCNTPTCYGGTIDKLWYCEDCKDKVPIEKLPKWAQPKYLEEFEESMDKLTSEDIANTINAMYDAIKEE